MRADAEILWRIGTKYRLYVYWHRTWWPGYQWITPKCWMVMFFPGLSFGRNG